MQWASPSRRLRPSTPWRPLCWCAVTICLASWAAGQTVDPNSCDDECRWGHLGATGVADLLRPLLNDQAALCRDYAARVAGHSAHLECGHVDVAEAVAACGFGETMPPHCHRHKNAAVAIMVVSHVASIAVWFPLARLFVLAARSRARTQV